jgi:hypothetical protein
MSIYDVISSIVEDKKEMIQNEISIIDEGITYLQLTQESLMASDIMSDAVVEETWECQKNIMALTSIKNRFKYLVLNIYNTDDVSDIYTCYGLSRNKWLENYKKGKA